MANFLRMLVGVAALPASWAATRTLADCLVEAAGSDGAWSAEALSLLGGMAAFALCWFFLPRMMRTYVLGHELTHALWGLMFGARPSRLKVGAAGGSVNLTKSNMLITLAPYFFPFYTFVVIVCALITYAFMRPLPFLPLWLFLIGFTWAFHALFTLETLGSRQPDVKAYGRIFSWTFIYLVNMALVLVWLASTTTVTFVDVAAWIVRDLSAAYWAVVASAWSAFNIDTETIDHEEDWEISDRTGGNYYTARSLPVTQDGTEVILHHVYNTSQYATLLRDVSGYLKDWRELSAFQTAMLEKLSGNYESCLPVVLKYFKKPLMNR